MKVIVFCSLYIPRMAILVALFSKLTNLVSSYVLSSSNNSSMDVIALDSSQYSMPLLYIAVLACVCLIGYFCWQSYRQEIHEEKLQEKVATKEEKFSSYNLTWVNKVLNWAHMSSPAQLPQAVERWIEDINLTLAKDKTQLKILVYGLREGSMSPFVREVGEVERKDEYIELPILLQSPEFGFMVSVQEDENGRVNASTYAAIVTQFRCWYTVILSHVDDNVLLKLEFAQNRPRTIDIRMKSLSDQKVASTVPEVVADILKSSVLNTPFYLNVSTWGPIIPISIKKPKSPEKKKTQKDDNGNTIASEQNKPHRKEESAAPSKNTAQPRQLGTGDYSIPTKDGESQIRKSNTMPLVTARLLSDKLKPANQTGGMSGSLGSLVGIKRTPSGRGPPKPIRSREKLLVMKVVKASGFLSDGLLLCKATLDYPPQKCRTNPVKSGLDQLWPDEMLKFDLSSRSSELKIVLYKQGTSGQSEDEPVASTVLHLDRINTEQPSEQVLPLKTMSKEDAFLTLQLSFAENHVDSSFSKPRYPASLQKMSSPRRSLDLSLIADHLPPKVDEKGDLQLKSRASTMSSCSSENLSESGSQSKCTTVTTTTRRKVTPVRDVSKSSPITSKSAPSIQGMENSLPKSDISHVNGSVADIAMNHLSKEAEIAEQSPEMKGRMKKGRLEIVAVSKSKIDDNSPADEENPQDPSEIQEDELEIIPNKSMRNGDEMYYSMSSLTTPSSEVAETEEKQEQLNEAVNREIVPETPQEGRVEDAGTKPKKERRKRDKRPKSMVAGVKAEDIQKKEQTKEWPKVRRSRSLVFGIGRKKPNKTSSTNNLHKNENAKEDVYPEGYEEDSPVTVPENDLQKHSKKKKSRSIGKLFSKLGRKPSMKKSKRDVEINEANGTSPESRIQESGSPRNNLSSSSVPHEDERSQRPNSSSYGSETDSLVSEATSSFLSPSLSHNSSLGDEKSSIKRSKSLRKRLFGGKRKSAKN